MRNPLRTSCQTSAVGEPARPGRIAIAAAEEFARDYGHGPGSEVVVVIPALNEAGSVAGVVAQVPRQLCGLSTEALVVDDGSTDATAELARAAGALVCRLETNVGQGWALRLGYRLARQRGARFVVTADADGQFDLGELPGLVAPLLAGEADFVNGSRRLGAVYTTDPVRQLGLVFFAWLVSTLTGVAITDPANGLRAMRAEVTEKVPLRQPQYQTSELLIGAIARGFVVKEVPATVYRRAAGDTKKGGNLIYGLHFAKVVVTTWWAQRPVARRHLPAGQGLW